MQIRGNYSAAELPTGNLAAPLLAEMNAYDSLPAPIREAIQGMPWNVAALPNLKRWREMRADPEWTAEIHAAVLVELMAEALPTATVTAYGAAHPGSQIAATPLAPKRHLRHC